MAASAPLYNFTGHTVLVTGGTSGIGLATAAAFRHAGARVIAAGLPSSETLPSGIQRETLDVTDADAVEHLFSRISELHILVNSAGIIRRDAEFEMKVFSEVIAVNLTATMRLCTVAQPNLARTRGCIVNLASMLSFFGSARVPAYSASKGAIAQLTRSLAIAWAADGIRVNAVAPGWITTPLTDALQADPERSAPLLARTPQRRWGRAEEIAGPVLFLCSEAASFMTGAIIPVDGGYSAS